MVTHSDTNGLGTLLSGFLRLFLVDVRSKAFLKILSFSIFSLYLHLFILGDPLK